MKKLAIYIAVWFLLGLCIVGQPPRSQPIMPMGAAAGITTTPPAGWALIGSQCDGSTNGNGFTTTAKNYTGANLIVFGIARNLNAVSAFTTSNGDTPTLITGQANRVTSSTGTQLRYLSNPTSSGLNTLTATLSGSSSFASVCSMAFSGAATSSPFDTSNGSDASSGSGTTIHPGSITPATNGQLIITNVGFVTPAKASVAIDTGYTKQVDIDLVASQHYGQAFAYFVQTTAAAINPTWSGLSNLDDLTTSTASFKVQ